MRLKISFFLNLTPPDKIGVQENCVDYKRLEGFDLVIVCLIPQISLSDLSFVSLLFPVLLLSVYQQPTKDNFITNKKHTLTLKTITMKTRTVS